jgi:hypothetical protein
VLLLLAVALAGADVDVDEVLLVTEDEHAVRIATASARTTPAATRNRGREVRRPVSEDVDQECHATARRRRMNISSPSGIPWGGSHRLCDGLFVVQLERHVSPADSYRQQGERLQSGHGLRRGHAASRSAGGRLRPSRYEVSDKVGM